MRALLQRVLKASVAVDGEVRASIGEGFLIYLGIHGADGPEAAERLMHKILHARVFDDEDGRMSRDIRACCGEILVISQVTLYGHMKKGNRLDMSDNMRPAEARKLYEDFVERLRAVSGLPVKTGEFGAMMQIESVNNGPVTFILDSPKS